MQSSLSRRYLINISQIGVSAQAVYWNYENSRPSSFLGHVEGFVCAEEAGSTFLLTPRRLLHSSYYASLDRSIQTTTGHLRMSLLRSFSRAELFVQRSKL